MTDPRELMKDKRKSKPKIQRDTSLLGTHEPSEPAVTIEKREHKNLEMAKRQNVQLEKNCNDRAMALIAREPGITLETLIEAFIEQHQEQDTAALLQRAKQRRQLRIDAGNRQRALTIAKKQGLI